MGVNKIKMNKKENRYINTSALQLSCMLFLAICHHKCYIISNTVVASFSKKTNHQVTPKNKKNKMANEDSKEYISTSVSTIK